MATKKKATPCVPYCRECRGTNVEEIGWTSHRADGSVYAVNSECPMSEVWCHDCDSDDIEIVYPDSMSTPEASRLRVANDAARENGPELLAALRALLAGEAGAREAAAELVERLK